MVLFYYLQGVNINIAVKDGGKKERNMARKISKSELVLMKIIWKNGGTALYSLIMEELEKDKNEWKNNTVLTLLSRLVKKSS